MDDENGPCGRDEQQPVPERRRRLSRAAVAAMARQYRGVYDFDGLQRRAFAAGIRAAEDAHDFPPLGAGD